MTIGATIDKLHTLKEDKKAIEAHLEGLNGQIRETENELIRLMDEQGGLTKASGTIATVSVVTSIKPHVQNWDEFWDFIYRHKYFHLLERRASTAGCRELFETKGVIPGVVPFPKRDVRLKSL